MWSKAAGIENYGTSLLRSLNFADIANAAGIRGWRGDSPEQVKPALNEAFAHPGPALVDVAVAIQELSLPLTVSLAQAAGFNLYMIKAMIHGDGNEGWKWPNQPLALMPKPGTGKYFIANRCGGASPALGSRWQFCGGKDPLICIDLRPNKQTLKTAWRKCAAATALLKRAVCKAKLSDS